jgi:hypothetical protein
MNKHQHQPAAAMVLVLDTTSFRNSSAAHKADGQQARDEQQQQRSGRPEGRTQHGRANEPAPPPPRPARASTTAAHCQRANSTHLSYLCVKHRLSTKKSARNQDQVWPPAARSAFTPCGGHPVGFEIKCLPACLPVCLLKKISSYLIFFLGPVSAPVDKPQL